MKSGKLVHMIQVQRATTGVNEYGTPVDVWANHKELRAEIVERSASEFINSQGAGDMAVVIFRTRFVTDIKNSDRVWFSDMAFNIVEITPIGRKKGLELRCEKLGDD